MNERDLKLEKILLTEEELKDVTGGATAGTVNFDACKELTSEADCLQLEQCKWIDKKCQGASIERLGGIKDALKW